MSGLLNTILKWFLDLFTGRSVSDAERLGKEETSNAQLQKGQKDIQAANDAAKKVDQEADHETYDPNNRDDPRNRTRGL